MQKGPECPVSQAHARGLLKLNELLSPHRSASNQLIGLEDASEDELRRRAAAYFDYRQIGK
jgi:low affinity Fe/Cu permease